MQFPNGSIMHSMQGLVTDILAASTTSAGEVPEPPFAAN
jgi:hypothetical protein